MITTPIDVVVLKQDALVRAEMPKARRQKRGDDATGRLTAAKESV